MDTRYAYAVGKIRALENRLLSTAKLENMLEANTIQDAFRELEDTEYAEGITGINDTEKLEKFLNQHLIGVYNLLYGIAIDTEIINLFLIRHDINTLKFYLKAKLDKIEPDITLSNRGLFTQSDIKRMVQEADYNRLPIIIAKAVIDAERQFIKESNPQVIDNLLDKAKYDYFFEILSKYESNLLKRMLEIKIDLTNINTFIRLKIRNSTKATVEEFLLSHGKLSLRIFSDLFEKPLEGLVEKLKFTDYGSIVKEAVNYYNKDRRLYYIERIFDDYLLNFLRQTKYIVFGIEPLIGYLFAKEYEIRNIRTIFLGKFNNISNDIITEVLRQSYII